MEAIFRPWEEPWVFGEDSPGFVDGVADEFFSGGGNGQSARGCREERKKDTLVYL